MQKGHLMAKLGRTLQLLQASWNWKQHGTSIVGKQADWWFVIGQSGALQPIVVGAALANLDPVSLEQLKAAFLAKDQGTWVKTEHTRGISLEDVSKK